MNSPATPAVTKSGLELPPEEVIFGQTEEMQVVRRQVETAANTNAPVLVGGDHGTGKEVVAKLIHSRSPRRAGSFVKVNCPAIRGALHERKLFGYERGAFTGACATKPGPIEIAERGTLFLDEIAELEKALQAKLLQLLQDGRFRRVGGQKKCKADVRLICASHHDLADDVERGFFLRNLFCRINALSIVLPPLTERRRDIPCLARYLVATYSAKYGRPAPAVNSRILRLLQARFWPGNIRELENAIKRYVILGTEEAFAIPASPVPRGGSLYAGGIAKYTGPYLPGDVDDSLKSIVGHSAKDLERDIILNTLEANRWNRRMAARALRISYAALLYKMREAGIPSMRRPWAAKRPEQMDLSEQPKS